MNNSEINNVVYSFADNTKVVQPVNKQAFYNEKGKVRSVNEMNKLFSDTAWDKRATGFSTEDTDAEVVNNVKEIHFTAQQKKNAKRDYKEFRKNNPPGFRRAKNLFVGEFADKLMQQMTKYRIKFNLNSNIGDLKVA